MAKHDDDSSAVDRTLRRLLEADAAAVERLIRTALSAGGGDAVGTASRRPALRLWWRWAPASVALACLALAAVWWIPASKVLETLPETAATPPSDVLRISNEDGVVTVTTPAGAKMIILPGDPS